MITIWKETSMPTMTASPGLSRDAFMRDAVRMISLAAVDEDDDLFGDDDLEPDEDGLDDVDDLTDDDDLDEDLDD
jgi:hypothetical protein